MNTQFTYFGKSILMDTHEGDHIGKIITISRAFYEQRLLTHIMETVSHKGIYVDIGANIGNHTVFFGKFCVDEVIAVEMLPANCEKLVKNVAQNKLVDKVKIFKLPLTADGRNITYNNPAPSNMGMAEFAADGKNETPSITIKDIPIPDDKKITLIKIDCENATEEVLKAVGGWIDTYRPHIVVEMDGEPVDEFCKARNYTKVGKFNSTPTWHLKPAP